MRTIEVSYYPFSRAAFEDPYPIYAELREHAPLAYNEQREFWALSRYADVQAALRNREALSNAAGNDIDRTGQMYGKGNFLDSDPPVHAALRGLVHRHFTPASIRESTQSVRATVSELLDACLERGSTDLAAELAWPVHLRVAGDLFGIPREDLGQIWSWFSSSMRRTVGEPAIPDGARAANDRLKEYLASLVEDRRKRPRDDLLSVIANSTLDGSRIGDEAVGLTVVLFTSAIDTPSAFLSNAMCLLAEAPAEREELRADPSLVPAAIEELLRFESPAQNVARLVRKPFDVLGQVLEPGSWLVLILASANRDERRFPHPDRLDFSRDTPRTLAFGEGIHFCIGAPLARMTARAAVEGIVERVDEIELCEGARRIEKQSLWGFWTLPAELRAS
jgi:cytochrome P450